MKSVIDIVCGADSVDLSKRNMQRSKPAEPKQVYRFPDEVIKVPSKSEPAGVLIASGLALAGFLFVSSHVSKLHRL